LSQLARSDLIEIGSHTATHPKLAALDPSQQADEVRRGKEELQSVVDHEVSSFAYPFGAPGTFDSESVRAVRAAGFARACCAIPGVVRRATTRFELPRMEVRDWDGDSFARRLAR